MGQRDLPNKNENQKTKKSKMFEKKLVKCILKRLVYSNISLIVILIVIWFVDFTDINECQLTNHQVCSTKAQCSNTPGSFNCICNHGYQGDGINCTGKYYLIYIFRRWVYLFVRDKLQDGWTNLNQTFCGDSDYPRIEFRPKRFRLQSKRSEKSSFPVRSAIRSPPLSFTVLDSSAGGKLKKISSHSGYSW